LKIVKLGPICKFKFFWGVNL